jgi:hypothetical protein
MKNRIQDINPDGNDFLKCSIQKKRLKFLVMVGSSLFIDTVISDACDEGIPETEYQGDFKHRGRQ